MPDLDVQDAGQSYPPSLSLSTVTAGQSVTLSYRLSNFVADFAPSSFTGIYRSTNSTISTSDFGLGVNSSASLSGIIGRSETFTFSTAGWAPGTYYIGAVADYANFIAESNETNNPSSGVMLTVTAPVSLLPDLDVQNAGESFPPTLSASSVVAGGSVTLSYRLSNFGPGDAPSSITGIYRSTDGTISISDTRIDTDANAGFTGVAGRTETATINTTGWAPGTYYIGAIADYNNAIAEGNESNNPSSGVMLTVTAPTTTSPEVTVLGNAVSIADGDTTPVTTDHTNFGSVAVGSAGVIRTFTVRNDGNGTLNLSNLTLPAGFTLVDGLVTSLTPGAIDTFQVRMDATTAGTRTGQITFVSNDPNESPFNFTITGTVTGTTTPALLSTYPVTGVNQIFQGSRDNDDTHKDGTALKWSYDFKATALSDVHAVGAGTVEAIRMDQTGNFSGYGNVITIKMDAGYYVTYAHLTANSSTLIDGARVLAGDIIALSGSSGTPGAHLHIQFGSTATMINTQNGVESTATLIANGSIDLVAPAYFPKLVMRFADASTVAGQTDTNYSGTWGIDDVVGNALNNFLTGDRGNDILNGALGNDILTGGAGSDTFVFSTALGTANIDTITDFSAIDDTIRLDDAIFTGLAAGPLLAGSYAENLTGTSTAARPQITYDTDSGMLYFDADGTGAGLRVHFATLTGNPDISNADFFVF